MPIPMRAKKYDFFARLSAVEQCSGHTTTLYSKTRKEGQNFPYLWMHKEFKRDNLAEIEAAMAGLYALIEPDHIPKVRAIYEGKAEQSTATISKIFPEFMSLKTFLEKGIEESKTTQLTEMGLAEILALSYFFEEDDLHKDNIGISQNKVVRVDFDMSAYPLVSNEKLRGHRQPAYVTKTPDNAFEITSRDLNQFPKCVDADPAYFPTKSRLLSASHGYSATEMSLFSKLTYDANFIYRAYQTFMKIILIPDEAFYEVIESYITKKDNSAVKKCQQDSYEEFDVLTSENENYQEIFYTHFAERKAKLKDQLIRTPRFRVFWERFHASSFKKIISQFENQNKRVKIKHQKEKISIESVEKNYISMCNEMKKISGIPVSDVDVIACDLLVWLEQDENKDVVVEKLQCAILDYKNETSSYFSWFTRQNNTEIAEILLQMQKLKKEKSRTEFLQLISQLLSLQSTDANCISKKLIASLLTLFAPQKTINADLDGLTKALIIAIQPAITDEENEWQTVSHFSSNRLLAESFGKPPG